MVAKFKSLGLEKVAIGNRYSRLIVTDLISDRKNPKAICLCDCGNVISPQRGALMNGKAKSCGCLRKELLFNYVNSIKLDPMEKKKKKRLLEKAWKEKNFERYRAINNKATRKFYKENPHKAKESCRKRRARLMAAMGIVSKNIDSILLSKQKNKCACCKQSIKNKVNHLDHITPLINGGIHEDANLQILCAFCNLSKGSKDPIEFMQNNGYLL